jgi:small subunit ribosomal protein S6
VRTYEVVFIAAPTLTTEQLDAFVAQMQAVVQDKNGKVIKVENWGKKAMAYKLKRFRDGYYVILTIEADGAAIAELERRFRVSDFVIRFLSVRIDEDLKRSEKLKAARQRKIKTKRAPEPQPAAEPQPATEPQAEPNAAAGSG